MSSIDICYTCKEERCVSILSPSSSGKNLICDFCRKHASDNMKSFAELRKASGLKCPSDFSDKYGHPMDCDDGFDDSMAEWEDWNNEWN